MKIIIFSDTHGQHNKVVIPDGDMLVFAGDMCGQSKLSEVIKFYRFLEALPHKHKIVIAGNHDWPLQWNYRNAKIASPQISYLLDEGIELESLKIYGSPWQPEFNNWAFNLPRNSEQIKKKWDAIPTDTDILITHGPPASMLDSTPESQQLGCDYLRKTVYERVKPKLHIFGHIHESYGQAEDCGIKFINGCVCDENYQPTNKPILVII